MFVEKATINLLLFEFILSDILLQVLCRKNIRNLI